MKKQQSFLMTSALIISCILSTAVFFTGYTKFLGIETDTGGDYPTFPDRYSQVFIGILYVYLHLVYFRWLLQPGQGYRHKALPFFDLLRSASPFLALAFIAFPLGNDIYLYLHYGLMGLHGVDPYIYRAGSYYSELYHFLRWHQSSTYGPVSEILFAISAAFVPVSKLLAIYLFKTFCLAAHLLNSYLIFRLMRKSSHCEKVTSAYLCNPLILFEQVGSGHIDIFVCTAFLLLIFCCKYKYYVFGFITVWLGFLTKTLPILWLPLVVILLIKQRLWSSLALVIVFSSALIYLLTITVLPTTQAWGSLLNPGVTNGAVGSFHKILATYLDAWPNLTLHTRLDIIGKFKLSTLAVFGVIYLAILVQFCLRPLKQRDPELSLSLDIGWVNLALFLIATPWLMPWYASILLPAIALNIDERRFVFTGLAFCLSSSSYYALGGTGVIQSWMIVGFPTLVLGFDLLMSRSKRYVI